MSACAHTPSGELYHAADPHLLGWVHAAEVDSFLMAHQRYGARPLDAPGADAYVADTALIAEALGVIDPPRNREELTAALAAYRPELRSTREAREAAHFIAHHPPLPLVARPLYAVLASNAVLTLPAWARTALRLRRPALVPRGGVEAAGHLLTRTIRWAMAPAPAVTG